MQLFAAGSLVGGAITLANVDDAYPDNPFPDNQQANDLFSELEDDEEGYRAQAMFVVIACSVAIVVQTLVSTMRGLFLAGKLTKRFQMVAIIVSYYNKVVYSGSIQ